MGLKILFCLFVQFIFYGKSLQSQTISWIQTNGPTGGRITSIAADSKGIIYCGTFGGNIFQSSTEGRNWEQIGLDETHDNVISIVTDQDGYIYFASDISGIYRKQGQSKKWEKINKGLGDLRITAMSVFSNGILVVGSRSGLYYSHDKGNNWNQVKNFNHEVYAIRTAGNEIYIGSNDGNIYYSADQFRNWEVRNIPGGQIILSLNVTNNSVYAGTNDGTVFHSSKQNYIWKRLAHFNENLVKDIEIDSSGNIYTALGGPSFSNEGGGVHLIPVDGGLPGMIFKDKTNGIFFIEIIRGNFYAGTNKGIYQSLNGGINWQPINNGIIAQRVHDIIINKQGEIFVGSYGGVYRSHDNGNSWIEINNGLDEMGVTDMEISNIGDLFLCTYTSSVFRSINNGETWLKVTNGLPSKNNWISSLTVSSGNILFAATRTGIYRSVNNGNTWEHLLSGLPESFYASVVADSKDFIYTGNNDGDVFLSKDLGNTWNKLLVKNPIKEPPVVLALDSLNRLYFGGRDFGVYRYSEIDHIWKPINNGLTNTVIRSMLLTKNGALCAGTGVVTEADALKNGDFSKDNFFISSINGESWSLMNDGLKHPRIRALAINSKGIIFAGSVGGGVYRSLYPLQQKE